MSREPSRDAPRVGVLAPYVAAGPEAELPTIAPDCLTTRVVRLAEGDPSAIPRALRALTSASLLEAAAQALLNDSVDAVARASPTTGYAIGFGAGAVQVGEGAGLAEHDGAAAVDYGAAVEQGAQPPRPRFPVPHAFGQGDVGMAAGGLERRPAVGRERLTASSVASSGVAWRAGKRDRLGMPEQAARVVVLLDEQEPGEVAAVIAVGW
jgi:hypothetical protein